MPDLFDQTTLYAMPAPCKKCGCTNGRIETRSGQDCVLCQICGAFQYNAPKTETGRAREPSARRTTPAGQRFAPGFSCGQTGHASYVTPPACLSMSGTSLAWRLDTGPA